MTSLHPQKKKQEQQSTTLEALHALLRWIGDDEFPFTLRKSHVGDIQGYLNVSTSNDAARLRELFKRSNIMFGSNSEFDDTEWRRQCIRLVVSILIYQEKDQRVRLFFDHFVGGELIPSTIAISTIYISNKWSAKEKLGTNSPNTTSTCSCRSPKNTSAFDSEQNDKYSTGIASSFEILIFFHACYFAIVSERIDINHDFARRIGFATQLMCKTWKMAAVKLGYSSIEDLLQPYITFDCSTNQFQVLETRKQGFSPKNWESLDQIKPTIIKQHIQNIAWSRSEKEDRATREVVVLFFKHLHNAVLDSDLLDGNEQVAWSKMNLYRMNKIETPLVFFELSAEARSVFGWSDESMFDSYSDNVVVVINKENKRMDGYFQDTTRVEHGSRKKPRIGSKKLYVPPGFPRYQRMPPHILNYISSLSGENYSSIHSKDGYEHWCTSARVVMESVPTKTLLILDATMYNLVLLKSTIKQEYAGNGVFAGKEFMKDEVVCYFYGAIVYEIVQDRVEDEKYSCRSIPTNLARFEQYALEFFTQVLIPGEENKKHEKFFMLPASFCIGGYINDPRYLENDFEYKNRNQQGARKANVYLEPTELDISIRRLTKYSLLKVRAIGTVSEGEELFLDYGKSYQGFKT